MKVFQSRSFINKVKKLKKKQKEALDNAVKKIMTSPTIGIEKKGDLKGIFIYKFQIQSVQYLLAYRFFGEDIELIMLGPHGNYYRDLKTKLKK